MKRFLALLASTALMCCAAAAHADVIYNWVPLSGEGNASGFLDITDEAYASGQINWQLDNAHPNPGYVPPAGPIQQYTFFYFGGCAGCTGAPNYIGNFGFGLTEDGNYLVGDIFSNNTGSQILMETETPGSPVWTIEQAVGGGFQSETHNCLDSTNNCNGDTGEWVLASAPQQGVPEPMSALLLLGGLGALPLTRKRARA